MKWKTETEQVIEREVVMSATYDNGMPTPKPVEVRMHRRRDYLNLSIRSESYGATVTLTPEAAVELGLHLIGLGANRRTFNNVVMAADKAMRDAEVARFEVQTKNAAIAELREAVAAWCLYYPDVTRKD